MRTRSLGAMGRAKDAEYHCELAGAAALMDEDELVVRELGFALQAWADALWMHESMRLSRATGRFLRRRFGLEAQP